MHAVTLLGPIALLAVGVGATSAAASPGSAAPATSLLGGAPGTVPVDAAGVAPAPVAPVLTPAPPPRRRFAIAAVGGLAAPTGFAGVEAAYRPHEMIELAVGVGAGGSGLQRAAMVRWRIGNPRRAIVMGAGGSHGHYEEEEFLCLFEACATEAGDFTWLNVEAGVEGARPSGFFARLSIGLGVVLDRANLVQREGGIDRTTLPYGALTVGQVF
jgi:hypothetical protein